MEGIRRARLFGIAAQRQHVGVTVDDAGGRREQGRIAVQRRLQRAGGVARERLHVEHAIGLGMGADRLQLLGFLRRGRDDQLAAIAMRDAVVPAIGVERLLAADAHPRHQAAGLVIDAGVDHLAVARRGDRADALGRLQNNDLAARLCEPPGDGKTDHPGTDHDAIHSIHAKFESSLVGGPRWRRISPPGTRSRSIALAHYRVVWDDLSGDPPNFSWWARGPGFPLEMH